MKEVSELNIIFSEILRGYSTIVDDSGQVLYLKHLTYLEAGELDSRYSSFLNQAKNHNIPTYQDRYNFIVQEKLWTQDDEMEVVQYEKMIQNLRINYSKDYLHSRRLKTKVLIDQNLQYLNKLKIKKSHYIGATAEQWANNKMLYYRVSNVMFSDSQLSNKIINDDTDEETFDKYIQIYQKNQDELSDEYVKKISLCSFFTNIFYLCGDDAYQFYGKPIVSLTQGQVNLFAYGRYFKNVLSQRSDIPKEIMNNPDEINDWIELRSNAEEAKVLGDENSTGASSLPGATSDDYKRLGINVGEGASNLSKALKKSGGTLKAEQLMKLEG
jgi:hypothetical protein